MRLLNTIMFVLPLLVGGNCYADDYSAWLDACEKHRDVVERILSEEQVSLEFYYLMVAESKCTDKATSNKGAQGFWQLMPATSAHYGCSNPHDIECSTRAASRYIKKLSNEFKSFRDVIAAYNMGGHNYRRIGKMTGEAHGLVNRVIGLIKQDNAESASTEDKDDSLE